MRHDATSSTAAKPRKMRRLGLDPTRRRWICAAQFPQSFRTATCLSLLPHVRAVTLQLVSTMAGVGSIRATPLSPGLNLTLLVTWPTVHLPPSSRRTPCTAGRRFAACSAGRSSSAAVSRRKFTRRSGMCTKSTSL